MTLAPAKALLTADEFLARPDADEYELIDGVLVERKQMGAESSYIASRIGQQLHNHLDEHPAGWVLESETTYQCFGSPHTLRRADVSFIRFGRLAGERLPRTYVGIAPDLAVEVVSPSNTADEVEEKVREWLDTDYYSLWKFYQQTSHNLYLDADNC